MPAPSITSSATASGNIGQQFSLQVTASNAPTSFRAEFLPPQLDIVEATGLIQGELQNSGTFKINLYASNAQGESAPAFVLTLTVAANADATGSTLYPVAASYPPRVTVAGGSASAGSTSSNTTQRANVSVPATGNGVALVGTNTVPRMLSFFNHGSTNVELCYGTTATAGNGFYVLLPGWEYETPLPTTAAVAGISASGTNIITPVEYL